MAQFRENKGIALPPLVLELTVLFATLGILSVVIQSFRHSRQNTRAQGVQSIAYAIQQSIEHTGHLPQLSGISPCSSLFRELHTFLPNGFPRDINGKDFECIETDVFHNQYRGENRYCVRFQNPLPTEANCDRSCNTCTSSAKDCLFYCALVE